MMKSKNCLPSRFVWTKFGIEAGEAVSEIFARKERERLVNGGVFLWGVGNNIGPSIEALLADSEPELLFSPILSAARPCDIDPKIIFRWSAAETLFGERFQVPKGSTVTSRGAPNKRYHYALVCHSEKPLVTSRQSGELFFGELRNLVSGRQLGSSQVTSVVQRSELGGSGRSYSVAMRVTLVAPYFVRLLCPVPLSEPAILRATPNAGLCCAA